METAGSGPLAAVPPLVRHRSPRGDRKRRTGFWHRLWAGRLAYAFLAPPVIAFIVFLAYPAIFSMYSSFFNFNNVKFTPLDTPWENYTRALGDRIVRRAFLNVLELFAITFIVGQVLSLLIAVLLNGLKRLVGLYRTIYYLPMVTSVVIVGALFKFLLRGDPAGPLNLILNKLIGMEPVRWLSEEALMIPAVAMATIWASVGGNVIIWTAGLKGVPREIYEAATIDGANRWRQFWGVTLPMLKPIVMYQAVLGFIGGMKAFGFNFTMITPGERTGVPTAGGITPVYLIYHYGFRRLQMGYASAVAYLLSLVILAISVLQFRFFGDPDIYD
jgi:multiple sugar transport system permease protein